MSSPELAVAKASFTATVIRHDKSPSARDNADHFQQLLADTITQCSRVNVQKCKQWILGNIVAADLCLAALAKYLVALSASFNDPKNGTTPSSSPERQPSSRRRRLHILYLLNDVLYHTKIRDGTNTFAAALEGALPQLIKHATSFPNCPKQASKIQSLLSLWKDKGYYSDKTIEKLKMIAKEAPTSSRADAKKEEKEEDELAKKSEDVPWVLPSTHGDPSTAWYDLPAGNWLPLLEPNSTRPMNPDMVRPLQMNGGPADQALIDAVKRVLDMSDRIYSNEGSRANDNFTVNEMGERVEIDEISRDVIGGETYYGWSRGFCQKMKDRQRKAKDGGALRGQSGSSQSDNLSPRRSSSPPEFQRRSLPGSPRRRSRSRSRRRDGSPSRGRSRSSDGSQPRSNSRTSSRSRSYKRRREPNSSSGRSRSQSREYRRRRRNSYSRSKSRSPHRQRPEYRSRDRDDRQRSPDEGSYQNRGTFPPAYNQNFLTPGIPPPPPLGSGFPNIPPPPPPPPPNASFRPPVPPIPFLTGQQGPYPNFTVPPPPPPQYQSQAWHPPPPPPMNQQQLGSGHSWYGAGNVPPPPPPPPSAPPSTGPEPSGHYWGVTDRLTGSQRGSYGRGGSHRGRGGYRGRGGWQ